MGIEKLETIERLFAEHGVSAIYVKHLATRQDNEKNQIVLGSSGAKNVLTLFPAELSYRGLSSSTKKQHSKAGHPIVEMKLNFFWLQHNGAAIGAPHAKIINYFQYPEARFSAFAKDCPDRPDCLIRNNDVASFGKRILFLGANRETGKTFGFVINERDDPLIKIFPDIPVFPIVPILRLLVIGYSTATSPRNLLLNDLREVCGLWHPSIRLSTGNIEPIPFRGNQGAGYTLEALLNIPSNSSKAPDKHGFEIKTFKKGGKISLMTPTADLGEEGNLSFREFMESFGWPPVRDTKLYRVFNGTFRYRKLKDCKHISRKLMLDIEGFHPETKSFETQSNLEPHIRIDDKSECLLISGWSLSKLLASWNEKHASACYVEYEKRKYTGNGSGHDYEYRYSRIIHMCEGTDIVSWLNGIASNIIYYDPGHDITSTGKVNQRPQWRMTVTSSFKKNLDFLYESVSLETL